MGMNSDEKVYTLQVSGSMTVETVESFMYKTLWVGNALLIFTIVFQLTLSDYATQFQLRVTWKHKNHVFHHVFRN